MKHRPLIVALGVTAILAGACGSSSPMPGDSADATGAAGVTGSAGAAGGNDAGVVAEVSTEGGVEASVEAGPTSVERMVTIPATANIFGSGHTTLPAPGGGGAGTPPTLVTLEPGAHRTLTVTMVSGSVDMDGPGEGGFDESGPDGLPVEQLIPGGESLYGIGSLTTDRILFVVGVFLDGTEPMDPGPKAYVVDHTAIDIYPKLSQAVFVGDGQNVSLDGMGRTQIFHVPEGATRFFLGFADFAGPGLDVGGYDANTGEIHATVTVTQ
jgi:hypothetical protein